MPSGREKGRQRGEWQGGRSVNVIGVAFLESELGGNGSELDSELGRNGWSPYITPLLGSDDPA
jgi:hypothetical protein